MTDALIAMGIFSPALVGLWVLHRDVQQELERRRWEVWRIPHVDLREAWRADIRAGRPPE